MTEGTMYKLAAMLCWVLGLITSVGDDVVWIGFISLGWIFAALVYLVEIKTILINKEKQL